MEGIGMKKEINLKELYSQLDYYVTAGTTWPANSVYEMMLGAILVQNTTWHNTTLSLARIGEATNFNPESVAQLSMDEV